jgi:hypothetical protein
MARSRAPIVLSDYSNLSSGAIRGRRGRTSAKTGQRGRARFTIEIVSEPITHQFDELALGKGPAEAAARGVAAKIRSITEPVSDTTQAIRAYQEQAYAAGKPWAKRRFGFRGGDRRPRDGELRKFNHSGTFADGMTATENKTEKAWTINVPANRLDPRTSRHAGDFARITDALRRLVPEMDDPRRLSNLSEVKEAIRDSVNDLIVTAEKLNQQLRAGRLRGLLGILGAARVPGMGVAQKVLLGG